MELNEYQTLARRTAKPLAFTEALTHAALGVTSEGGELAHTIACAWMQLPFEAKNVAEEIGDASWFAAYLCDACGWDFVDMFPDPATLSDMSEPLACAVVGTNPVALSMLACAFAADIATVIKAYTVYGKELDVELLKRSVQLYASTLSLLSDIHDIPYVAGSLVGNIAKLRARYPEVYSDFDAVNRADKAVHH